MNINNLFYRKNNVNDIEANSYTFDSEIEFNKLLSIKNELIEKNDINSNGHLSLKNINKKLSKFKNHKLIINIMTMSDDIFGHKFITASELDSINSINKYISNNIVSKIINYGKRNIIHKGIIEEIFIVDEIFISKIYNNINLYIIEYQNDYDILINIINNLKKEILSLKKEKIL